MKVEPVAWATEDGRVAMAKTRDEAMPNAAKVSFNIPLYDHAIPPGYALVRVEPTEAMIQAGNDAPTVPCTNDQDIRKIYKAMLTAAAKVE